MVMLQRGNLRVPVVTSFGVQQVTAAAMIGQMQTFNGTRGGTFKPGILKICPVTISRTTGTASYREFTLPYVYGGRLQFDHKLIGHLAGAFSDIISPPEVPVLHPEVSINKAMAKLNKPDLDVGLMLGELSETIKMLRHPLSSLYPLVTKFRQEARKRSRSKPSTSFDKILSSSWLEYSYGILPLLSDIQDIRDYFEKKQVVELEPLRRQAASNAQEAEIPPKSSEVSGWLFKTTLSAKAYSMKRVTTHIYYKYNKWAEAYHQQTAFGVNPFQAVDVAWALVPYSFVVDWFIDVGTWLKAIQPHPQIDILGGCTSIKTVQSKMVETYMSKSLNGASKWVPTPSRFDWERASLDRVMQTTWGTPPSLGTGIDTLSKAVNSAAMLWQRIPLKW